MSEDRPLAALDIGSNTVRLYVGHVENGALVPVLDESAFVRLGLDVDRTGRLRDDRQQMALEAIQRLAGISRDAGAGDPVAVATSAVRDAENGRQFVDRVRQETGVEVEILTGEREAELTFLGATLGASLDRDTVVVDLGGGSAEIIAAGPDGMRWGRALPLGSGRLSERYVRHDPPTREELDALAAGVVAELRDRPPVQAADGIFTGGTASHMLSVLGRSGTRVDLGRDDLGRAAEILASEPAAAITARYRVPTERARVLPAGVWALRAIACHYRLEAITVTRTGIREGVVLDALRRGRAG